MEIVFDLYPFSKRPGNGKYAGVGRGHWIVTRLSPVVKG